MKIHRTSFFKDQLKDIKWFKNWVAKLETFNGRKYGSHEIQTGLGKTHVWSLNSGREELPVLVIFPGARTTALFWDLNNNLDPLLNEYRIYLVETNGLQNLSDGNTPDIKTLEYGQWASEVLDALGLDKVFVAGASFGGLICMKLALVNPERIQAAFLLNPGCLQPFSLSLKNLYFNLLPILSPSRKNVSAFLDKAVFCKPRHTLPQAYEDLVVDYELFALTRFVDKTQKPYYMNEELRGVSVDTYLIVGDHDLLFPFRKSVENARKHLRSLKRVIELQDVGHGVETLAEAIHHLKEIMHTIQVESQPVE